MRQMIAAGVMVWAGTAEAMQPACHYDHLMREAVIVVQVEGIEVGAPDADGYCVMTARVARSFRGDLALGDALTINVPCLSDGTMSGTIWTSAETIARFPVAEVHLDPGGTLAAHGFGLITIPGFTDAMAWRPITTEICE
jgi:hypothetical protein